MRAEVSQTIGRPIAAVFHFYAHEHVRNHPRWDPEIELEQLSPGPIGVGTVIRRRNSRSGAPVEGTMEITEFERDQAFGAVIHEGPVEIRGRATFEPVGADRTLLTVSVDMPEADARWDVGLITSRMERSVRNIKELVEAEP
jgi:hypothetical protein